MSTTGLDMYLHAKRYVSGWDFKRDPLFEPLAEIIGIHPVDSSPSFEVSATVAYWRKANMIHAWFMKDEKEDTCQEIYVQRKTLIELRDLAWKVWVSKDPELAEKELPTQTGFFFGSYGYDDWYWEDLEHTIKQLDKVLSNPVLEDNDWDFYYRGSW